MALHPLCALIFTLGYILRLYGATSPSNHLYSVNFTRNLIVYIMSQVFIYICPPLLELANYHVLGRLLQYIPHLSPMPPHLVLRTFGILMALVELLNSLGVSFASNPSSGATQQSTGSHLIIAALVMQLGIIASFAVLAGMFHFRCAHTLGSAFPRNVRTVLYTLYASMTLILIRSVYRLAEHAGGNTNVDLENLESLRALTPVLRYEWWFYVFEATLMLANSLLWNLWHPGRFLPRDSRVYLARDGVTEVMEEERRDERTWWMKVLHIWSFGLLFPRKRGMEAGKGGLAELADIPRGVTVGDGRESAEQRLVGP